MKTVTRLLRCTASTSPLPFLAFFIACLVNPVFMQAQSLIAGWDFQTTATGGTAILPAPNTQNVFQCNVGAGTLYLNGSNGSSSWTSSATASLNQLNAFTGTALNAGTGMSTTTTSPACLSLVNSSANGFNLVFMVSMTHYTDLVVSYATQRTTFGFTTHSWEYSSDGLNWVPWQSFSTLPTAFAVMTLNTINALDHSPAAFLRLNVTGATSASGNNRLDNIRFTANFNPLPYDPAITALSTPTGFAGLVCTQQNETLQATICNQGGQPIDLSVNPVTVTYHVSGPQGLTTYAQVLNSGILGAFASPCVTSTVSNVDLAAGGSYLVNAYVSCPSLSNSNTQNDSMPTASSFINAHPAGTNYALCTGGTIPSGQGLIALGCNPFNTEWYESPSGGNAIFTGPLFDPLSVPNTVVNNSSTNGQFTFYASCSVLPGCRTPVKLIIDSAYRPYPSAIATNSCIGINNGSAIVSLSTKLNILSPALAQYTVGTATFGPSVETTQLIGEVEYFSNPDPGCSAYPAGTFAGKIALIDRGSCYFEEKAYNAQQAGAIGVIIVNNVPGPPTNMGPINMYTITIPLVMVSDVDGQAIKNMLNQPMPVSVATSAPMNSVLWSTTETTASVTGLATGIYTVSVTNSQACPANAYVKVVSHNVPALSLTNQNPCTGASSGSSVCTITNVQQQMTATLPDGQGAVFPFAGALFGPPLLTSPILGNIYYYSNPDLGCIPYPVGTFNGWIAMIDRGTCFFEEKVHNAEQAGALGVIIVNNVPGPIFTPGIANLYTINIPSAMISQADGQLIKNWFAQGYTTIHASTPVYAFAWTNVNAPYPQPVLSNTPALNGVGTGNYQVAVTDLSVSNTPCQGFGFANLQETPSIPAPTLTPVMGNGIACGINAVVLEISNSSRLCATLDGAGQWIDCSVNTTNLNDADFTLETWLRAYGTSMGIIVCSDNDTSWEPGERAFYLDSFGRPAMVGWGNNYIFSAQSVNDFQWHHVAVTWNYTSATGKIYIDGIDQTSGSSFAANAFPNLGTFSIGRPNFGETMNFFQGEIDELRIWNVTRTLPQIRATMNYPIDPEPGLVSCYRFDDAGGVLLTDHASGFHATPVNQPGVNWSNAFNNFYNIYYGANTSSSVLPRWGVGQGVYTASITSSLGCTSAQSDPFNVLSQPQILASGPTTFCDSGASVTLSLDPVNGISRQYATRLMKYSSQFDLKMWGALQTLGKPNIYPQYGDLVGTWASSVPDAPREYLELGFAYGEVINYIDIYETFNPGAVDTVYVKDISGNWQVVYAAPATIQAPVSRIMHIKFPATADMVNEIRIALNSAAVPGSNEIDAVAIGYEPGILWSNGDTTIATTVNTTGNYSATVTEKGGCVNTTNSIAVTVDSCSVALDLKLFIEGYYAGFGQMHSVLMNQGVNNDPSICDSIMVDVCQSVFPYAVLESAPAVLHTNGTANVLFHGTPPGTYYINVRHRNALNTWSADPLQLSPYTVSYDFSDAITKAYGNNMREVEPGVWALFAGELIPDENIDLLDASMLEAAVNAFNFGYYAEDINGDGNVDLLDVPVLETNLGNFVFSMHP